MENQGTADVSGYKFIPLEQLLVACEEAKTRGKTPLIVDSAAGNVDTFFSYRACAVLDGKKMGLDKSMRKIPVPEIMEDARKKLVSALKYGYPFVVAMTTSVTDFATCFNDASATSLGLDTHDGQMYLPQALLQQGGQLLLEEKFLEGLFRKEDREGGVAYCRSPDTFQVILTTRFALEDFDEYLFGNTWGLPRPRENYAVIVIQEEAP